MKISHNETFHFDREGFSGDVYVGADQNKGFNSLLVHVNGKHPRKKMIDTIRTYFVIEGSGTFQINNKTFEVQRNDYFVIDSGDEYEYQGRMSLFETNISPQNSFKDESVAE